MSVLLATLGLAVATLGSKLLLALIVIYFLIPEGSGCPACDGDTIRLVDRGIWRVLRPARLQRRWCLTCWRGTLARSAPAPRIRTRTAPDETVSGVKEGAPPNFS